MIKLCFFVPLEALEAVKSAVFAAGAGRIGQYDQCCWQCEGTGQFRPLDGSDPYLGQTGQLETVVEYKVETVCADERLRDVIVALRKAHPYEEPAYEAYRLLDDY